MSSRQAVLEQLAASAPVIAPSLLKCDFSNLQREVEALEAASAQVLHLDVMDAHFVPNLTYGPVVIEHLRRRTQLPFDAHLMISDPGRYAEDFIKAGCNNLTIHLEAVPKPRPLLDRIRNDHGVMAGLAINPGTPVEALDGLLDACDVILVMSVEPGFGGQKFQPSALPKLRWLNERRHPGLLLGIDGGIGPGTIEQAAESGADLFVVGSAIFDTQDYTKAMTDLTDEARTGRRRRR